jgi:hypothetical protein
MAPSRPLQVHKVENLLGKRCDYEVRHPWTSPGHGSLACGARLARYRHKYMLLFKRQHSHVSRLQLLSTLTI